MAKVIDVTIHVNGKQLSRFHKLRIQQSINVHHTFEIHVPFVALDSGTSMIMSNAIKLIGTDISISLKNRVNKNDTTKFDGVITHIRHQASSQQINSIVLTGNSKTVVMDGTPTIRCFTDKKLGEIIADVGNSFGSKINIKESVEFKSKLKYRVQHNETSFDFLRRLASEFGESFYYDGTDLIIGKLKKKSPMKLAYPKDLTDISFGIGLASLKYSSFNYDYVSHKNNIKDTKESEAKGVSPIAQDAAKTSFNFFESGCITEFPYDLDDKSQLDKIIKKKVEISSGQITTISGETDSPGLNIGTSIQVSLLAKKNSENTDGDYGEFIISAINHSVDGIGNYTAQFEGLANNIIDFPNPFDKYVNSASQVARVENTDDPDKLGRIKVALKWMKEGQTTNWIRIVSEYAGSGYGSVFLPEVGDQVMIGFEHGNPSMPFVLGSVYQGQTPPIGELEFKPADVKIENTFKSSSVKQFMTKAGNKIVFDDKSGDEKILISDSSNKNGVIISVKDSKIEIHSEKDVLIKSKNITLDASKDITMKAKGEIKLEADKDIVLDSKANIKSESTQNITSKAGMDMKVEAGKNLDIKGSVNTTVEAGMAMKTKGTMLNNEASAINTIKGALVKIN